ncbi:MAG: glycosyltransferase family 39 protein [Sedimentisphaerales bacterium]|nr:glycosyltransferase family 39 protein [Sedimentisphaerales bacterium]
MTKHDQQHKRSRQPVDHKYKISPPSHLDHHLSDTGIPRISKTFIVLIIIILVGIPFCLGKYFEFNSPDAFDSGAYIYSAKRILDGAKIGIDEKPSAQMGTLLVNMLGVKLFGFNETGPTLIQAILQAAALILMFITMRRLFGTLPATVGIIIASFYLSAPLMAKYGNVKEQHMIAFMIMGVSCFVFYRLSDRFWIAILAGFFLLWAPLFKETGISAISAVGLFVIAQPIFKHRSLKKTAADILLLAAGAVIAVGPIYIWLYAQKTPPNYFPFYSFVGRPLSKLIQSPRTPDRPVTAEPNTTAAAAQDNSAKQGLFMKFMPAYVRDSWNTLKPEQIKQAKLRVFRWYRHLILPIALALGSIIVRLIILVSHRVSSSEQRAVGNYDRFVLLFAVWWILDMLFVWISPRSYEQYYLPLNASASMLSGYLIAIYNNKLKSTAYKPAWVITGLAGLILMIIASQHIFFGVKTSAHSGVIYRDSAGNPIKQRGYIQKWDEIARKPQYSWINVAKYIKDNSTQNDKIYVWGWLPGIYVAAQRLSPAPKAFEGTMHTLSPQVLSERVEEILNAFKKEPPKFLVDSRKQHFPWDRPSLELWPIVPPGFDGVKQTRFLPLDENLIAEYDKFHGKNLEAIDPVETLRYQAMKSLRQYVMNNYRIVQPFGAHILFQRK